MPKFLTLFLIFLLKISCCIASNSYDQGARSKSLGNIKSVLVDNWSSMNNPAGIGWVKKISTGISYENQFLLKELSTKSLLVNYPIQNNAIGISMSQYGYSLYSENQYGLSFGQKFTPTFSMGLRFNYLNIRLGENYGKKGLLLASFGTLSKINNQLTLGTFISNISNGTITDVGQERIPPIIDLGLSYQLSDHVLLALESEKQLNRQIQFKYGFEYTVKEFFYLRSGIQTLSYKYSLGVGVIVKSFEIDIASTFHSKLGPELCLSITCPISID